MLAHAIERSSSNVLNIAALLLEGVLESRVGALRKVFDRFRERLDGKRADGVGHDDSRKSREPHGEYNQ